MFGIYSRRKSSADNVEFSYESSNSLNSTFAGITLSWIDDYWLMKCLTAESLERLIPILGVIGSIPKVASMKTKKVTLATGFLQSLFDLCFGSKRQQNKHMNQSWCDYFSFWKYDDEEFDCSVFVGYESQKCSI